MKQKLIGIVIIGAILATVAGVSYHRATEAAANVPSPVIRPAVVRTAPLMLTSRPKIESFYGFIEAAARVEMAFQIPGRLKQIGPTPDRVLKENQVVEKGEIIATLELDRYEAQLRQAEARINIAKAGMAAAQAGVDQAQAQFDDADREYRKIKSLFERKVVSDNEYDKARLARQRATALLDAAKAQLEAEKASYDVANADAVQARIHVEDATLRAPFRSIVAAIPLDVGAMIQPSQPVITLVNMTHVRLVVGVTENKVPLLREGQVVEVDVMALRGVKTGQAMRDEPLFGRVTVVPPAANRLTRLFNVEIEMDNVGTGGGEWLLKPGMVARANVYVKDDPALAVPADAAVRVIDGKLWAYFVREGFAAGLDMGEVGGHAFTIPTPVVQQVMLPIAEVRMDSYLVTDVPDWCTQLVIDGQTRVLYGQPVIVLGQTPAPAGNAAASDPPTDATQNDSP